MLYDRVYFATATTGTGTVTAGAAETGFRTMLGAGIPDGMPVEYAIVDGSAWETGAGVVGATSTTLTRAVSQSSNANALLNLTGAAKVLITPIASAYNMVGRCVHAVQPQLSSGSFVSPQINALATSTIAAAANRLDYIPFIPAVDIAVDRMDIEVSTLVASALGRLAIYADNAGVPGGILRDGAATIDCSTTGLKSATITTLRMVRNTTYWLAILSSSTQTYRAMAAGSCMVMSVNATLNATYIHKRQTQTFASGMPATASGLTDITTLPPLIKLRIA